MKRTTFVSGVLFVVLLCSFGLSAGNTETTEDYALLTITVEDIYRTLIDNARVTVTYLYPRADDVSIPDQFTTDGTAVFNLEVDREYVVTITKAGFISHTEEVDLEEDTTLTVTLEYLQNMPVLQVSRYTVSPQEVGPGEQFQLHLVVENRGTGDALTVKVFPGPTQVFSPVQPSSSAYLERLDKGKVTSVYLTFTVTGEALSGVYDLALTITYQDASGLLHTAQETAGIPIVRKPLIKLLNMNYPSEIEQGTSFTFSVEIANIGRFPVNGVYVEVESDMGWEYYSYYIGSLEAGDFDTFTSEVKPGAPGEHTVTLTVGFIDDFNREHSQTESFTVKVIEKTQQQPEPVQEEGLWARFIRFLKAFLGLG